MGLTRFRSSIFLFLSFFMWHAINAAPIVGGDLVSNPESYTYIVSLQEKKDTENGQEYEHFCGGALINKQWILTAAHCVHTKEKENLAVIIGEKDLRSENSSAEEISIEEIVIGDYDQFSMRHDIALLKLNESANIQSSVISIASSVPSNNTNNCKVIGYGAIEHGGKPQDDLRSANIEPISDKDCVSVMGKVMGPQPGFHTFCALGKGTDTCQGDSGGPLVCGDGSNELIYGITSHGVTCGSHGVPSVYTSVSPYLEWINETINH